MNRPPHRRGFTLVEMLAVIVIIGILASLATTAVIAARAAARRAAIRMEITSLGDALETYKAKYNEYPPDFTDLAAVQRHLTRAFPRYNPNQFENDMQTLGINVGQLNGITALAFWLGGPDGIHGFSANSRSPFDPNNPSRISPFYEFKRERLRQWGDSGALAYYPDTGTAANVCPFVYFRASGDQYNTAAAVSVPRPGNEGASIAEPYARAFDDEGNVQEWVNPNKFQLISAGLDDNFGTGERIPQFPDGFRYTEGDYDNIANFSNVTLEDEMP